LAEARTGSGDLYKVLKANGVALDDLAKMDVNEALRVFVDILANARDATDRLKFSTLGFGKGGADLALTFAGGTDAMRAFAEQAHRTAQVITNETVQSAQELDDKFTIVLGTISQIVKSGVVDAFSDIADEIDRINGLIETLQGFASRARAQPNPFNATVEEFEKFDKLTKRIDQSFENIKPNAKLLEALQKKATVAPSSSDNDLGVPGKPSVLPPPASAGHARASGRNAAADAAKREHDQVVELIAELQRELSLVGATDEQRRISNELHQAGAAATETEKQKITELVSAIEAQEKAQEELIDTLDTIRDAAGGALDAFVQSIANSEGPLNAMKAALKDILQTIIQIAERQLITNLLGAAGSSALGGIKIPGLSLGNAAGAQAVNVHITATPSPLLDLKIHQSGRAAESRAIARGPAVAHSNNQRFAVP
jgi:hypothetical protein